MTIRRDPYSKSFRYRAPGLSLVVCSLSLALVSLALFGCFRDAIRVDLPGNWVLVAVDSDEQLCVAWEPGDRGGRILVPALVVEVGWDDHFIVAANRGEGAAWRPLSFYYIDLTHQVDSGAFADQAVVGPLTEEEFLQAKNDLDLPEFTVTYGDLR